MQNKEKYAICIYFALIIFACGILYSAGLNGPFMLDDFNNVHKAFMQEWNWDHFLYIASHNTSGSLGRIIPTCSFAFTSLIHGTSSWGFKYHNLLIHISISIFTFIFIFKLFNLNEKKYALYALFAASYWLVHPLHISTALYPVQRMAQFSTLFTIIAITAYLYGRTSCPRRKITYYLIIFPIASLLGIFSKENAALIPFFILIIDQYVNNSTPKDKYDKYFIACCAIAPILLGLIILGIKHDTLLDYSVRSFSLYERILTQVNVIWFYIKQLGLPRLSQMGVYLDYFPITKTIDAITTIRFITLTSLLAIGLILNKRANIIGFGILFFFTGHLLESTIIPLEIIFEHRNYLPSIGFAIVVMGILKATPISNKAKIISIICLITLLSCLLNLRASYWKDEKNFIETNIINHPKSLRAALDYSSLLQRYGLFEEASEHLEKTKLMHPNEVGLILSEITLKCEIYTEEEIKQKIEIAKNLLGKYPISTYGFNALSLIVEKKFAKKCATISIESIHNLINTSIELQQSLKEDFDASGYLYLISGRVYALEHKPAIAKRLMLHAFYNLRVADVLFETVDMLSSHTPAYTNDALSLYHDMKKGKYFNTTTNQYGLTLLEEKMKSRGMNLEDNEIEQTTQSPEAPKQ